MGIAELKISAKEEEIFWDTQGGGMVDGERLNSVANMIDRYIMTEIGEKAMETHAAGLELPFDGDGSPEFGPICCGEEMDWVDCAECEGTGIAEYEDGGMELCGDCNGEGGDYVCPRCGATGREIRVERELNQREE